MSEITERSNIFSIDEVTPIRSIHASVVKLYDMSSYQSFNKVMSNMVSDIPVDVMSAIRSVSGTLNFTGTKTSIKSPNVLRTAFKDTFSPSLMKMETQGISPIIARKATFLNTMNKMDFKITQSDVISSDIKAILKASEMKILNTKIKTVMNKLEAIHSEAFLQNIANACATASYTIGFREVVTKTVQGKLEVIATNNHGQRLLSEINIDTKTNQVNTNTETIGITDGSCSSIINQFNDELKKMNIKIVNAKNTFTGGVCQMSYAKMIDKQDKKSKKLKEIERTRKLNTNKQLKN